MKIIIVDKNNKARLNKLLEWFIYMIGYTENQVDIYTKKLSKALKELPYGFGAAIGYSMIMDNIKTIDDAINEATIEMQSDKESYR